MDSVICHSMRVTAILLMLLSAGCSTEREVQLANAPTADGVPLDDNNGHRLPMFALNIPSEPGVAFWGVGSEDFTVNRPAAIERADRRARQHLAEAILRVVVNAVAKAITSQQVRGTAEPLKESFAQSVTLDVMRSAAPAATVELRYVLANPPDVFHSSSPDTPEPPPQFRWVVYSLVRLPFERVATDVRQAAARHGVIVDAGTIAELLQREQSLHAPYEEPPAGPE